MFNTVFLFLSVAVDDKLQSSKVFSSCHINASSGQKKEKDLLVFDILKFC